jgi:hypothetical protein
MRHRLARAAGLAALIAAVVLSAACNAGGAGKGSNMNTQNYSNDGYLGTTNANPHIPGRFMALTYANDARMMQNAVRGVDGVTGANVTFNGANAYITLKLDPGIDSRRIPTIERQAAAVLRFNFPRYNIFVQSLAE